MEILHFKGAEFEETIGNEYTLVDFYADWCGPCKMLAPILEELKEEIKIVKVNVDENQEIAMRYGVMSIPTLIFFKDGKVIHQMIGFSTKEDLLAVIKEMR
ncbi:MAG TPA: thioredoxin [Bacilli bacterium]|nr:thioredoxin [Bacilli bacterium]